MPQEMETQLQKSSRTIATFSVSFAVKTRIECALHMVRAGSAEHVCSHTMTWTWAMRSPEHSPGKPGEKTVTLWITEEPACQGRMNYSLESSGGSDSTSWHSGKSYERLQKSAANILVGGDVTKTVPEKETVLCYIEGDTPFNVGSPKDLLSAISTFHAQERRRRVTVAEFGEQNKGNYLLVTMRWYTLEADYN